MDVNTEELHEIIKQYLVDAIDHGEMWENLQSKMEYYGLLVALDEYGRNEEDVCEVYLQICNQHDMTRAS